MLHWHAKPGTALGTPGAARANTLYLGLQIDLLSQSLQAAAPSQA